MDTKAIERGEVCWHCSDEDSGPDVGISVGLGGTMLYAGEIPSAKGWSIKLYNGKDSFIVAEDIDRENAREMIERLGLALRTPPTNTEGE